MSKVLKYLRRSKKTKKQEQVSTPSNPSTPSTPSLSASTLATVQTASEFLQPTVAPTTNEHSANASTIVVEKPPEANEDAKKPSEATTIESRIKYHERALKVLGPFIDAFGIAKNAGEAAGDVSGPIKAAFGISEKVLTMLKAVVENDKAWEELAFELEDYQGALKQLTNILEKHKQTNYLTPPEDDLTSALDSYAATLVEVADKILESGDRFNKKKAKSYFKQIPTTKTQGDTIRRLREDLRRAWSFLQGRIDFSVMRSTRRVEEHVANMRIAQILRVADAAGETIGKLLQGTREETLKKICAWADDISSESQIFWLCDGPGTGKSTIAAHLANVWAKQGRLFGRFFFSKEDEHTRDLTRFCSTVAKQAIEMNSIGKRYIVNLPKDPSFLPFTEKFDLLIKGLMDYLISHGSLQTAGTGPSPSEQAQGSRPSPLIIVIDSLDQCDSYDQTRLLEALLERLPPAASAKILLTSTPLPHTSHLFQKSERVLKSEAYDHASKSSRDDIELYVRGELTGILLENQQDQVIEAANGVFQLAFVACESLKRMIHKTTTLKRLGNLKLDPTFNGLYTTILDGIKADTWAEEEEEINAFRTVLQAIVLAYRPVTVETHHAFLPDMDVVPDYVQKIVSRFAGIIKIAGEHEEGPVYILHPTFRAYLLALGKEDSFNIAASAGHAHMANGCLTLLNHLHQDLCGVIQDRDLPLPISKPLELPPKVLAQFGTSNSMPLRYAVVFWPRHAAEGLEHEDMREKILPFFETRLLMWIEWAAAIRELSECIIGLKKLARHLDVRANQHRLPQDLSAFKWCQDALRFLTLHKEIIEQSPLQVYYSALAFDPQGSLISTHYKSASPHALPTVLGYSGPVLPCAITAMAVSPTGDLIATASEDHHIRLWDGATGEQIGSPSKEHTASITCLSFSSTGNIVGSGAIDGSLGICRIDQEKQLSLIEIVQSPNGGGADCLSFSEDEGSIICKRVDNTVAIWGILEKRWLSSHAVPEVVSTGDNELGGSAGGSSNYGNIPSYIAISRDLKVIALSYGQQLRLFAVKDEALFEFVTIKCGRPAQPVFSRVLSKEKATNNADNEYLYWGDWIIDIRAYQHDRHRVLSKASADDVGLSSRLDWASPANRPSSLLYAAQSPSRVNSYRMAEDEGLLLFPPSLDIRSWAATGTSIVVGTNDGRLILVKFTDAKILGKEGEIQTTSPVSDAGYETAGDGNGGEDIEEEANAADFVSAIEGALSRRGSAA